MNQSKITINDIKKYAQRIMLKVDDSEAQKIKNQIENVIAIKNTYSNIDVSDIKPTFHPLNQFSILREDKVITSLSKSDELLAMASDVKGSLVKV